MTEALSHPYRPDPAIVPYRSGFARFTRWLALRCPVSWQCHRRAVGGHWEYVMGAFLGDGIIPIPGWIRVEQCTTHSGGMHWMGMSFLPDRCEDWPQGA